ncbi:MAG: right-handed parallel beta-helix repeat-containing protein [Nitrospirota bacterium]
MKFICLVLILFFPGVAFAGGGVLRLHDQTYNTDQTWSGTVIIDGVVQFGPKATLKVLPGTTIEFTRNDTDGDGIGENEIYIQGRLIAEGTSDKPVTFTSAEKIKRPGDWGAVNIMVSQGKINRLSHCIIEYGYRGFHMHFSKATITDSKLRNNYMGIQCQDSDLDVDRCEISGNKCGAIVFRDSRLKIRDCNIHDNRWGIRFLYGKAEITGNTITGNLINGITFSETKVKASGNVLRGNRKGISADKSQVEITGNILADSYESGLYLKRSKGFVTGNQITGNGYTGISITDSDVKIAGNNIRANGIWAIDNGGEKNVDATGNWFGPLIRVDPSKLVYDKSKDAVVGKVTILPQAGQPFKIEPVTKESSRNKAGY